MNIYDVMNHSPYLTFFLVPVLSVIAWRCVVTITYYIAVIVRGWEPAAICSHCGMDIEPTDKPGE